MSKSVEENRRQRRESGGLVRQVESDGELHLFRTLLILSRIVYCCCSTRYYSTLRTASWIEWRSHAERLFEGTSKQEGRLGQDIVTLHTVRSTIRRENQPENQSTSTSTPDKKKTEKNIMTVSYGFIIFLFKDSRSKI